jgi:hypothetical protein
MMLSYCLDSYFLRTGDINAPLGARDTPTIATLAAPLEGNQRRVPCPVRLNDDDKELKILLGKLEELHQSYFQQPGSDVRVRCVYCSHTSGYLQAPLASTIPNPNLY